MNYVEYTVRVFENGNKGWYLNGKLHREGGPAIERAGGDKIWYLNGVYHREDGPAIEHSNGYRSWYLNGKYYFTESEFNAEMARRKQPPSETCEGKVVEIDGKRYQLTEVK